MADHDHVFKLLFAHPRLAGDLVREFLPRAVARQVDPGSVEPVSAEHLGDRLQVRVGDLVWRLRLRDGRLAYLLLEFQSRPDRAMALRMLAYTSLFAQGLVRRGELRRRGRLPPVLPVVLYNGRRPWRAAGEVSSLFAARPRSIAKYRPRQRFLLLDVERLPQPVGDDNLAGLLFRLERSRAPEETWADLESLRRELRREASPELQRAFGIWLMRGSHKLMGHEIVLEEGETMFERAMAQLRDHFVAEGEAKGKAEGKAEGLVAGEARILLRLLAFKFGPLDAATRERVASATPEQLGLWAERLLIAPTLSEVFEIS